MKKQIIEIIKQLQIIVDNIDAAVIPQPVVPQPIIVSRSTWGASAPQNLLGKLGKINKITLHHTAGKSPVDYNDAIETVKSIQRFHMMERDWADIGYHYLVSPQGYIFEGRAQHMGEFALGAHTWLNNSGNLGIAVMGDYTKETLSDDAKAAVQTLVDLFTLDNPTLEVTIHNKLSNTKCPGFGIDWIK